MNEKNCGGEVMEQFSLFIKQFIEKQYRDKWLYLSEKGMDKVYKNISQLEKHLDKRYCHMDETSTMQAVSALLDKYKLDKGFYISFDDRDTSRNMKRSEWDTINSVEYIIIYPKDDFALYFHHSGYVWVCDRKCQANDGG